MAGSGRDERLIERVKHGTVRMYGELEGIRGSEIPALPALEVRGIPHEIGYVVEGTYGGTKYFASQNDVDYWSVRVLYHTMGVLWDRSIGGPSVCGSTACSPGDGGVLARDLSTRWGKRMANVSGRRASAWIVRGPETGHTAR